MRWRFGVAGDDAPVSADDAREAARDILAGRDFERSGESLLDRMGGWLADRLQDLFGGAEGPAVVTPEGGGTRGPGVAYVVGAILLVLLVVLIWRATRHRWRVTTPTTREVEVEEEEFQDPDDWDALARRAAGRGDWAEAVRCGYRSTVASLARDGTIREIPGRTTGEHRADVQRSGGRIVDPFFEAADLFDRTWYGGRVAVADDHERMAALSRTVAERQAVGSRS